MHILQEFFMSFTWETVIKTSLRVFLILGFAWIAMKVLLKCTVRIERHLIQKSEEEGEPPSESQKRVETLVRLIKQAVLVVLWLTVGLVLLKEFGVEIGPVLASAGIAGVALGFGAQGLVRDIIAGFFLILENQIRVGDVAVVNGTGGLVEKINLRTTVLRDLSGTVHIFPNGTIATLSNMTNEWSAYVFDIGVAYKENTDHIVGIIEEVGKKLRQDTRFGKLMLDDPEVFGVDKLGESSVIIKGRIRTKPIRQWDVGREFLRRVKLAFDENRIEIPFPQRSITFGEIGKVPDVRLFEKPRGPEPAAD